MAVVWTTEDFCRAANERGLALTRKEATELLDDVKVHYDRQYGFQWTDLWDLIDSSGFGRKMTKQETTTFLKSCGVIGKKRLLKQGTKEKRFLRLISSLMHAHSEEE